MIDLSNFSVRSFIILFYDEAGQQIGQYQVPVSVAAPFANRISHEILNIPDWGSTLGEPWYTLAHRTARNYRRSSEPMGPTSLYGGRYDAADDAEPAISLYPDAVVHSFEVRLLDFDQVLFEGEYSVDDIFLHGARFLLQRRMERGELPGDRAAYHYEILPSSQALYTVTYDLFPEDAYEVQGVFHLPPIAQDSPRIQFRRVAEPALPERTPESFDPGQMFGSGEPQAGLVMVPEHIFAELRRKLLLSEEDEEGGYLLGNVYRQPTSPEAEDDPDFCWIVEVTDLLMAEGTVGSPAQLLFTGDSWSAVSRRRDRDFPDRKLVGWFHTHVFPATENFGLSGLDQDMHGWYLPKPWQVAILLNLEHENDRTVRCYQRGPDRELVETPFTVIQ